MKNAIAIRHVAFEDLGTLGEVLQQKGYSITYLEAGFDYLDQINPLSPDLVVVLGACNWSL